MQGIPGSSGDGQVYLTLQLIFRSGFCPCSAEWDVGLWFSCAVLKLSCCP